MKLFKFFIIIFSALMSSNVYTLLENQKIQLAINYIVDRYQETNDPIHKINYALRIAILYYQLQMYSETLKYLNTIINEEPTIDFNAKDLDYHNVLLGLLYYSKIHLDGKVVPQNFNIAIKYFKEIRTCYNNYPEYKTPENEKTKRLAYFYLGKIKHETDVQFNFEYPDNADYTSVGNFFYAALKNNLLPENLKKEAEDILFQIEDLEELELEEFFKEKALKDQQLIQHSQVKKHSIKSQQKRKCICEKIQCIIQ